METEDKRKKCAIRYPDEFKKEVIDYYNEYGTKATLEKFKISSHTLDYFKERIRNKDARFGDKTMVSIPIPQTSSDNVFIVCCKPHQLGSVVKGLNQ